jgi:hypothetical protein
MANRNISEGRRGIFVVGQIISVVGLLSFGSVFLTAALNIGDFDNFDAQMRSSALRAFGGIAMLIAGSVLMGIGRAGLAGSGVVLDPERAREDLEPWARMAGGMMKDGMDEAGIVVGTPAGRGGDFAERLRELHALHQEGILSDEEYAREKAEVLERK